MYRKDLHTSASSKTAIIAAYLLAKRDGGVQVVGLTSAGNRAFVEGLNVYDSVYLYDYTRDTVTASPTAPRSA